MARPKCRKCKECKHLKDFRKREDKRGIYTCRYTDENKWINGQEIRTSPFWCPIGHTLKPY